MVAKGANVGEIEVGPADDGDLLASTIDAGVVQRLDVVDGGEVIRSEVVGVAECV